MSTEKPKSFADISADMQKYPDAKKVSDILGKEIVIQRYETETRGDMFITFLHIGDNVSKTEVYYTTSKVVKDQLVAISPFPSGGMTATIVREQKYYKLV